MKRDDSVCVFVAINTRIRYNVYPLAMPCQVYVYIKSIYVTLYRLRVVVASFGTRVVISLSYCGRQHVVVHDIHPGLDPVVREDSIRSSTCTRNKEALEARQVKDSENKTIVARKKEARVVR